MCIRDSDLRHPRPGRGDGARRPDRRHEPGEDPAGGDAARDLPVLRRHLRGDLRRIPPDEPPRAGRRPPRLPSRDVHALRRRGRVGRRGHLPVRGHVHRVPRSGAARVRERGGEIARAPHRVPPSRVPHPSSGGGEDVPVRGCPEGLPLIRPQERSGPPRRRGVTSPAPLGSSPAPYRGGIRDRKETLAKLLIAPAVLYIVAMIGAPFVLAILYSLSDATTGDPSLHLVGLRNFGAALEDPVFRLALWNTFVFTLVSQSIVIVLSRILANALLKPFRGKWLVRFLILLPWTAPISLGTIGWLWMFDSIFSPIDWVLRYLGMLGTATALLGPETNMYLSLIHI